MRKIVAMTLVLGGVSAGCKPRDSVVSQAKIDQPAAAARDCQRGGGLRGTSDGEGRFRIKGDYPTTASFLTSAPPSPSSMIFSAPQSDEAMTAAKEWMAGIQAYIYEDMTDHEFALEG